MSELQGEEKGYENKRWKCPNPDCSKWSQGKECSNCNTSWEVKRDLQEMKAKRNEERDGWKKREGGRGSGSGRRGGGRGGWRDRKRMKDKNPKKEGQVKIGTEFEGMFSNLRDQLDKRHDKMERIVKLSRDITIESKRIIFHLHRIQTDDDKEAILKDVETRLDSVKVKLWRRVAIELRGEEDFQFLRSYTAGLQEWIEALSFYHYICLKRLIPWQEVQQQLVFQYRHRKPVEKDAESAETQGVESEKDAESAGTQGAEVEKLSDLTDQLDIETEDGDETDSNTEEMRVEVPQTDYVLGLADLTGELMRNAINSLSCGDRDVCFTLLQFLQNMYGGFLQVEMTAPRLVSKKLAVLKQSLRKVEDACYAIEVRGSEIPKNRLADIFDNLDQGPATEDFQD